MSLHSNQILAVTIYECILTHCVDTINTPNWKCKIMHYNIFMT